MEETTISKETVDTKKEIEIKREELYLNGYIHNNEFTIKEFIVLFLCKLNMTYETYLENDFHTKVNKERSLGDIYNICKTYYPDVTPNEIKEYLLDLGLNLVGHYCPDIGKRVYNHLFIKQTYVQHSKRRTDEYDLPITYKQKNNMPDVQSIINKYDKIEFNNK